MRVFQLMAVLLACSHGAAAADIVTVTVKNRTALVQTDVPVTFGQIFAPGDVPAGSSVEARFGGGGSVPLQVDTKATHGDGSLRHAVLTTRLTSLPSNGSAPLVLSTGNAATGAPVSMAALLATNYNVNVSINVSGTLYTGSARQALQDAPFAWLSGPQVSEWIARVPLRTASLVAHPHLVAYFHVRAYAGAPITRVRTDVVLENGWTLVAAPSDFTYDVNITVPDNPGYSRTGLTHYSRARWHKALWWGVEPRTYAQLDTEYLQDTRAIPNYEDVAPTNAYLDSLDLDVPPMDNGDQSEHFGDTGFQEGIGPLPLWDALYAVSSDVRAFDYMRANADGGSAFGMHFRDEQTGLPATIDSFPNSSLADASSSNPPIPVSTSSPFSHDIAHQPSIGFTAYLATGDYFYLEEMQFWSAHNLIATNHVYRNHTAGWFYTGSIRGQAWSYRSLAQAAYLTPDAHPLKNYFRNKLLSNIDHDIMLYVAPGGPHKNNLGAMYAYDGNEQYLFFDYFMSWAVQYVYDLDFTQIAPFRNYKLRFPIGIMGVASNEYCFQAAAQFKWKAGPPGTTTFYPDFRTMYVNTDAGAAALDCGSPAMAAYLSSNYGQNIPINGIIGTQSGTGHYFANLQAALAAAADSGVAGGITAWQRSQLSGVHPDYRNVPIWAIAPRVDTSSGTIFSNGFEG